MVTQVEFEDAKDKIDAGDLGSGHTVTAHLKAMITGWEEVD